MFSSIRFRLTVFNVFLILLVLSGSGVILLVEMRSYLQHDIDQALYDRIRPILNQQQPPGAPPGMPPGLGQPGFSGLAIGPAGPPPGFNPPFPGLRPPPNRRPPRTPPDIRVLNEEGIDPRTHFGPFDQTAFKQSIRGLPAVKTIVQGSERLRLISFPRHDDQGNIIGVVQAERSLADMEQEIADLTRTLLFFIPFGMVLAGVLGAILAGGALRPVKRIADSVDRIQARNLDERLPVRGSDEFAQLASTVNGMLARLQAAFEEQRRFTSDASHELKTPLTVIKAKTSVALTRPRTAEAYKATIETVDRAADQMADIVQDLLLLAHADSGQLGGDRVSIPVREIAEKAVAGAWSEAGPKVTIEMPDAGLVVCGNFLQLTRAVRNLVQNAVDHTPHAGRVTVGAIAREGEIEIDVSDTGEGIGADHIPHLTERFYRVDSARSRETGGSGLGLAIVKSIIEAHGGRMEIQSIPGSGTLVRLYLPQPR